MVRGVEINASVGGFGILNSTPLELNTYVDAKVGKIIDDMVKSGKAKPKSMDILLTDDLVPDLKSFLKTGKLNDKIAVNYKITA